MTSRRRVARALVATMLSACGGGKAAVPTEVELQWPDASTMVPPAARPERSVSDAGPPSSDAMAASPTPGA